MLEFMTRDVFDGLIVLNLVVGGMLAAWRIYRDLRAPLPHAADTQEHMAITIEKE